MSKTNDPNMPDKQGDDLYTLLKIDRSTKHEEIQKSYKTLSKIFHPDRLRDAVDKHDAQKSFLLVKQAHDILSDPLLRLAYDHFGLAAVNIVKRSQQQHSQQQARNNSNNNKNKNGGAARDNGSSQHDDDESSQHNDSDNKDLYQAMQEATPEQAVLILQQAMDESEQDRHASSPHFDASIDLPFQIHYEGYGDDGNNGRQQLERDTAHIHFHCRSQPTPHLQATIGATSQVQRTAETDISLSSGLNYQPAPGSQLDVNATMNHQQPPQLSFRTQRQLASGTVASIAVGGSMRSYKTWTYSASSFRTLQHYSGSNKRNSNNNNDNDQEEPTKLQAFWRISLAATGNLKFAMASIRTMKFPQWRCRISSSALPLKLSYQADSKGSFYIAWSTAALWSRIKIMTSTSLGRWKFRYGIKYDGGSMYTGGMPWTVMCKIQSSDWTISLPIGMMGPSDWPVVWLSTMMVSVWVDSQLEKWKMDQYSNSGGDGHDKSWTPFVFNDSATTLSQDLPHAEMIGRVASKKRQIESSRQGGGLVILRAVVHVNGKNNNTQDVTNVLQFWVVQSRLCLPVQERQWWWRQQRTPTVEDTSKQSTMWTRVWCQLTGRPPPPPKSQMEAGTGVLTVRYQHGERVYEIVFQGDELVLLPNDRAMELGPAAFVA
jgi:curved DNA-binding protein CbpA